VTLCHHQESRLIPQPKRDKAQISGFPEESDEDSSINNLPAEARQHVLEQVGALDLKKYCGASIRVSIQ
jgi:hypothetical protein